MQTNENFENVREEIINILRLHNQPSSIESDQRVI